MKTLCKITVWLVWSWSMLCLSGNLSAQVFVQKTYGGKIEGSIRIDRQTLEVIDRDINEVVAILQNQLKVYRYELGESCKKLTTENLIPVPVAPEITITDTQEDHYVLSYAFGMVSQRPILVPLGTQTYLDPHINYTVRIDQIQKTGGGHRFMAFKSRFGPMGGVAYLNECDRVFECYNFTTYRNCVN